MFCVCVSPVCVVFALRKLQVFGSLKGCLTVSVINRREGTCLKPVCCVFENTPGVSIFEKVNRRLGGSVSNSLEESG